MWTLVGARIRAFGSRGLGVSTFSWGRVTDTPEREVNPYVGCAHPNFVSSGARVRSPNATRLGSVHLPGDARRTHVRRSPHLSFYDPKVEGRQVTRV
ncbi:hypothetical protein CRG98_021369 [Punica granatum]|uniref:Uncharacterized protein n=1 Tax=Punica granatum TaxID=22663 RepID=A0A2I0JPR9_PUNGR|nr:hypothetical protein CRG98_021369 [Punica granatum]